MQKSEHRSVLHSSTGPDARFVLDDHQCDCIISDRWMLLVLPAQYRGGSSMDQDNGPRASQTVEPDSGHVTKPPVFLEASRSDSTRRASRRLLETRPCLVMDASVVHHHPSKFCASTKACRSTPYIPLLNISHPLQLILLLNKHLDPSNHTNRSSDNRLEAQHALLKNHSSITNCPASR